MKITEILNQIQVELKAPKGQYNGFGKYKYRSCEDILEGLKPLLKKTGATLVCQDDMRIVGDRYYLVAEYTLSHPECESVEKGIGWAREALTQKGMNDAQITGSTSSYARKYALNALFCIDDTKDADTMDNTNKAQPASSGSATNSSQDLKVKQLVLDVAKDKLKTGEMFKSWRKENKFPDKLSECTNIQLNQILDLLND